MISNGKELYNFIDNLLKLYGYIRKKDTWYLHTIECICFFTLEKSPYGSGYYGHVMGCFLKEIYKEKEDFPKYYKNHLSYHISEIVGQELVKRAFCFENQFVDNEREVLIESLIQNCAIIFLKDVSTKEGIRNALNKYDKLQYNMKLTLKAALNIPIED